MEDQVILVDLNDHPVGVASKLAAHRHGELHRAVSIFVFDSAGRVMLQKRAPTKYHSGGLWSNTCCSHPRPHEEAGSAAHRRLQEEMGVKCEFHEMFSFVYRTKFDNSLIEYEYDHVFFGHYDGCPVLNPEEAEAWKWMEIGRLSVDVRKNPENYTFWLVACVDRVVRAYQSLHPENLMEAPRRETRSVSFPL